MKNWITILKGLAIVAVVFTHVLSSMPPETFTTSVYQLYFVLLDQSFRFCVPLFVALSGYALSKKYQQTEFKIGAFYRRRLSKLLPLYFIWSALFIGLFTQIKGWNVAGESPSVITLLVLGRADYHLYFVAMIFQLYLLFPVLQWLLAHKALRHWVFIATLLIQTLSFWVIHMAMLRAETQSVRPWLATDQHQYLLATSWIGYFGLGMWLSYFEEKVPYREWIKRSATLLLASGWLVMVMSAVRGIAAGGDPLYELRFTRFAVLIFALAACYIVIVHQRVLRFVPVIGQQVLLWVGKHSYLIYLSHTLFLRIWFAPERIALGQLQWLEVLVAGGVGIAAVLVSLKVGSE